MYLKFSILASKAELIGLSSFPARKVKRVRAFWASLAEILGRIKAVAG